MIDNVSFYNDLGVTVTVDKSLAFNNHISNVINKCNKVNGMIRPSLGNRAPVSVSNNFYKARIQPIIRYALHHPTINYQERCEYLNISPLSFHRKMIDIKLFF